MNPLLRVQDLSTHFQLARGRTLHAVDGVTFKIARGAVTALVGESGSGKSTLGKAVLWLAPKTAGSVYFDGRKLPDQPRRADFQVQARDMTMVFQDPQGSLNPRMTIADILI